MPLKSTRLSLGHSLNFTLHTRLSLIDSHVEKHWAELGILVLVRPPCCLIPYTVQTVQATKKKKTGGSHRSKSQTDQ